ncbi:MAG: hypothetical protein OHK0029_13810 [Armatimonadaceae bacterium]
MKSHYNYASKQENSLNTSHTSRRIRLGAVLGLMTASTLLLGGMPANSSGNTQSLRKPVAVPSRQQTQSQTDSAIAQKLDAALAERMRQIRGENPGAVRGWSFVIAQLKSGELSDTQKRQLIPASGYIYRSLPIIQSVAIAVPTRELARIAALPFVERLSADLHMEKTDEFTVEGSGAAAAEEEFDVSGKGVTVAVLDTGIGDHKDLRGKGGSRVLESVNFVPDKKGKVPKNADDECGHGTHVAGIIAGDGSESTGKQYFRTFRGIAPEASLVDVRVLDETGQGTVSDVIAGIQWVLTNQKRYGIRVVNLSAGHEVGESFRTDPLCRAVEAAWQRGVVVVCAAGNGGRAYSAAAPGRDNEGFGTAYGSIQSPANSPSVITVGAMKRGINNIRSPRDMAQIATYSSRGPSRLDLVLKPDLVAPGDAVIATQARSSYLSEGVNGQNQVLESEYERNGKNRPSRDYLRLSGTSMAAPVVSGAVALLLEKEPRLTPDTVKARLMLTADKWTHPNGAGDACTFGAGYINIPAALRNRAVATVPALSPSLILEDDGTVRIDDRYILVPTQNGLSLFGTGTVGSLQAIWGGNAVQGGSKLMTSPTLLGAFVWEDTQIYSVSLTTVDLSSILIQGDE